MDGVFTKWRQQPINMLKKFLIVPLVATLLLLSCSKDEDSTVKGEFIIEGLHDIILDTPMSGSSISFNIAQSAGIAEPIILAVTTSPNGITTSLDKSSGTPPFSATIRFKQQIYSGAGIFPVIIIAKSASITKTATINLIVPALNGWIIDSVAYNKAHFNVAPSKSLPGYYEIDLGTADYSGVFGIFKGTMPVADGIYPYKVIGYDGISTMSATDVYLSCFFRRYSPLGHAAESKPVNNELAVLTIKDGKYSFTLPPTVMVDYDNPDTLILAVNASQ